MKSIVFRGEANVWFIRSAAGADIHRAGGMAALYDVR